MSEKPRIRYPVIVEGKYDKITLSSIFDGVFLVTDGFGVFNDKEKQAYFRKLAAAGDLILLCDSDGGGAQIRSFLAGILPPERVHTLRIPNIEGKERRKTHGSKAGTLGVEGMKRDVLVRLLSPFIEKEGTPCEENAEKDPVTRADFYRDGLSGGENAAALRDALAAVCDLPSGMSAKALLEAVNLLLSREEYVAALEKAKNADIRAKKS